MGKNVLQIGTIDIHGGAAKMSWALHQSLLNRGFNSRMYVGYKYSEDYRVKSFYSTQKARFNYYRSAILANNIFLFNTDRLFNDSWYQDADIVHLHNLHPSFFNLKALSRIAREKKVVWTLHDMWAVTGHCAHAFGCVRWKTGCGNCPDLKRYPRILWDNTKRIYAQKKNIYKDLDIRLVVPSSWLADIVKESILSDHVTTIIPNGIDLHNFLSTEKKNYRQELNLPLDKVLVLFVADGGTHSKIKGGDYFQQVTEHFRRENLKVEFICIGGDDDKQDLNVRFVSRIEDGTELVKYYKSCNIFLSLSRAESFGLVFLEAMAAGLPIVSFGVGVIPELINSGSNGYIAENYNIDEIIHGIENILSWDKEKLEYVRLTNSTLVKERYSIQRMIESYIKLYNKL